MRRCLVVLVTAAMAFLGAGARGQSFDCGKARTPVEHAICAEPSLGALDQALAAALTEALARPGVDGPALRSAQSAWLRARDATCKVPPARLANCLTGVLSARLAALAPAVPAPPAPPASSAAVHPPTVLPPTVLPPTIPSAFNPAAPDAVFDRTTLPASEPGSALLQVRSPGRFSLSVRSGSGTAIQLVDMMAGPGPVVGEAGVKDGRTDVLLDTGTYRLRVLPAPNATGSVELTAAPFRDAGPPTATPDPGVLASAPLADLEQRAFWLAVGPDGVVQIDAVGRALADLRLWHNGTALAPLEASSRLVEPVRGHPMLGLRLAGTVEPGTYLVTAYGGVPLVWADGVADMPFHLRAVAPVRLAEGWVNGSIGPMGSEWFAVPARANAFWLTLPDAAAASLSVDGQTASIAANSREPVATVQASGGKMVEVGGVAGQAFRVMAQEMSTASNFAKPGRWWVSASMPGSGGEAVAPTALLLLSEGNAAARVLGSTAPLVRPGGPWRTQFNVRGPTTLLLQTSGAGALDVRNVSQGLGTVRWQPRRAQMPAGFNEYFMEPLPGRQGVADLVFSLGNAEPPPPAALSWPANPIIPFGVQSLSAVQRLELASNVAPGLQPGLLARPAPVALAEGALVLAQMPGVPLEVPVRVAPGGRLAVSDPAGGDLAVSFQPNAEGVGTVALPPTDRPRMVVLAWRRPPVARVAIPAPPGRGSASAVGTGTPRFFDLQEDESRSFDLTVPTGGLYRVETTGRLHSRLGIGTAFTPLLDEAEANGAGENALLQRWLRAGSYRVRVGARGSAGHLGLLVAAAPMLEGAELRAGGTVRAALPAGSGLGTPLVITEAGRYRLELLGQGRRFNARLDDAEGWPLTAPGPLETLERDFSAGHYRLLVSPEAVAVRVVARLSRVAPAVAVAGHGPHALRAGTPAANLWREPAGRDDARVPDSWRFALRGPTEATLRISVGMVADLRREGVDGPVLRLVGPAPVKTRLEAGRYTLEASSLGRNDRLNYTLGLNTAELQPGIPRRVEADASVPFTLTEAGVVTITTFGPVPLTAVLRDQAGRAIGRYGDRGDDWNIAVSRLLPAGSYWVALKQAVPPELADVPAKESAAAEASGDSDEDKPEPDPGEPDPQSAAAQTEGGADRAPDAPDGKPRTEITLDLPAPLDPVPAPAGVAEITGAGVHRFTLPQPASGRLLLATAHSGAAVTVTLERQDGAAWGTVAEAQGTDAVAAVATDGQAASWRLSVWTVDQTAGPIRVAVAAVEALPQVAGRLEPRALDAATEVAVARLHLDGPAPVRLAGPVLLAGGWPGHGLTPPDADLVSAESDALWVVARTAAPITATPVVATPGEPVALSVGAGSVARLGAAAPALGTVRVWRADAGLGQPGLDAGQGMGVAAGSALAVGAEAVRVWNAGGDTVLRPRVTALDLAMEPARRVDGPLSVVVPARSAVHLTLPEGERRTDLALAPEMAAVAGSGAQAFTVWGAETATARSLPGGWTDLLLLNTGGAAAPASVAWSAGVVPALRPGAAMKRFFGAAGSLELLVEAGAGARLRVAGAVEARFLGQDGHIARGTDLVLPGSGRLTLSYAPGLLAVWLETPDSTAWPAVLATPQPIPARVPIAGDAMALSLAVDTPSLLHARTSAPVILTLGQEAPTLYPAGGVLHRAVSAATTLRIDSPQDGPLTGSLELEAEAVTAIADGLGAPVTLGPGGTAVFAFQVPRATEIGVGVRADPGGARTRLLRGDGGFIAEGAAMLRRLEVGRYLIEVSVPADGPSAVIRPAVVGIAPRGSGPPPDVARSYLALVGLAPKEAGP